MKASEITREQLQKVAGIRNNLHRDHRTSRPLSENYQYIGLVGEHQFSLEFDLEMDLQARPNGDRGIDFSKFGYIVDVKTARKAYYLLREEGKDFGDILVLAQYDDDTDLVKLLGWEYDAEMIKYPKKDFGYGIVNHYKPARDLKSIKSLHDFLEGKIEFLYPPKNREMR
jgi:hypothetical protein